ncbi:SWIM zinc finger family protein [Micrococcus sp. ACRRV]|uniref:SWIM zinc finger family protein n=1 Tax=Micrococcus sp. ACRRV TaxID=2918203 RepID=UPI001EF26AFA|nr:SWIM zinc finger family protein [Micrococcus sp. ACRRV]MCG7422444.1 SWIM zinc finger family protein [Micrococcus sp. ACRRV]
MAPGVSGDPLPHLRTEAIRALVGPTSADRGFDIAAEGGVLRVTYDASRLRLTSAVRGTAPQPYRQAVRLQPSGETGPDGEPLLEPTAGRCQCPVGEDCKHVAAALYEITRRHADAARHAAREELASRVTTADRLPSPERAGAAPARTRRPRRPACPGAGCWSPSPGSTAAPAAWPRRRTWRSASSWWRSPPGTRSPSGARPRPARSTCGRPACCT